MPMLGAVGVELVAGVQSRAVVTGGLRLDDGPSSKPTTS